MAIDIAPAAAAALEGDRFRDFLVGYILATM
jgi:hypothetical protein